MGASMGGNGALRIAFKHPELFGAVAAHSAAVLPRDPDQLDAQFPWLKRFGGGRRALETVFDKPLDRLFGNHLGTVQGHTPARKVELFRCQLRNTVDAQLRPEVG